MPPIYNPAASLIAVAIFSLFIATVPVVIAWTATIVIAQLISGLRQRIAAL